MKNNMRQVMKTILLAGAVMFGLLESAGAYSLGGPIGNNPKPEGPQPGGDSWQVPDIGYNLGGDLIAPKNLGEEYRRNTPVMYYACDPNFIDYFGANGVTAIQQAMAMVTSAFTNNPTGATRGIDGYSANLLEFPLETRHFNYQAQALGIYDLKSATMGAMMEQMSLADPVRYVWTLHDRDHVGPVPCPVGMQYLVVQRSFDTISSPLNQLQASPYVNNTLYSYQILEVCGPPPPLALSVPYSVDPLADTYSPVASSYGGVIYVNTPLGLQLAQAPGIYSYGSFYTGLTRDDAAGLRYLYSTNNMNLEDVDPSSTLFLITTNFTQALFPPPNLTTTNGTFYFFDGTFGYGNYGYLVATSKTNSPAALQALYPGLQIASSTNFFVYATNWVFTQYFTNQGVGSTYPPPLTLVTVSNAQVYLQTNWVTTFANVFTNHVSPTTTYKRQTITVTPNTGAPFGSPPVTNVTTKTIVQNIPSGDFFVLTPFYTNFCPFDIVRVGLTNVQAVTNFLTSTSTNVVTPTNSTTFAATLLQINYFTNYTFIINPVTCTNSPAPVGQLYQGIGKIQFVYAPYDSLLNQNVWPPVTNNYSLVNVTNSQAVVQHFQRVLTQPDFVFSATDQTSGPGSATQPMDGSFFRNVNFDQNNVGRGLAGPGTVTTSPANTVIGFNKSGPAYYNGTAGINDVMDGGPFFTETPGGDTTDSFYSFYFVWGSFDGTTNAPVVYANGESIEDLANQVLIQITTTPSGPFTGTVGESINIRFNTSGGAFQTPYSWSGSNLPPGTSITSNADNSATLSGTPSASGNYLINLVLTDSLSRSVQWNFSITIQ